MNPYKKYTAYPWKWLVYVFFIPFTNLVAQQNQAAKLVFYRENSFLAYAISNKIYIGDSTIVKLRNDSYFEYWARPGKLEITVNKTQKSMLRLDAKSGQTYYIRFGIKQGFWSDSYELILVDSLSAYDIVYRGKMRKLDKNYKPLPRPKNRLGLNLFAGFGLDNLIVANTTDGEEVKVSFGGGIGFGLKYGHEFSRNFDVALDFNYINSGLRPRLSNASVSFDRFVMSVTPSYIVPIDGGEAMRLKFGLGADYYFGSTLSLDLASLSGGIKDDWKYNNPLGFHLSTIFELNISKHWALDYGLRWNKVSYNYESGVNRPFDAEWNEPDGSSIDLLIGLHYQF